VHGEYGGWPQGGEGIAHQEIAAPEGTARLFAGIAGLLPQLAHQGVELGASGAAHRRQQPQGEPGFAGLHFGAEGVDHRHADAIRAADAEIRQITALRGHIAHHQFAVGTQEHVGLFRRLLTSPAGRCHHRGAGDQHLSRQHRQLIRHLAVNRPASDRHQLFEGAIGVAEDAGVVGVVELSAAAQGRLSRGEPIGTG